MTSNQIAYWNLKELERTNKEKEREARRSNLAKESETKRTNLANEDILVAREEGLNKRFKKQLAMDSVQDLMDRFEGVMEKSSGSVGKIIKSIFS